MKRKIKSLKFFIKHQDRELKEFTLELMNIKRSIEDLLDRKASIQKEIQRVQNQSLQDIASISHAFNYIQSQKNSIIQIETNIAQLQKRLDAMEEKVKERYAQKKGLEKLLQKNRDVLQTKERMKERQIADESFVRKYLAR